MCVQLLHHQCLGNGNTAVRDLDCVQTNSQSQGNSYFQLRLKHIKNDVVRQLHTREESPSDSPVILGLKGLNQQFELVPE